MADRLFVDTSFVLALINERDQYHEQALNLSYRFEESRLITTVPVLLEIGNALAKGYRKEANAVISLLRSSSRVEVVELDRDLLEEALVIYEKYEDKTCGLVDCISFVVMQERALTSVLTFDKDFAAAGFSVIAS